MSTNDWLTCGNSNILSTGDSSFLNAMPGQLAAPRGWRSEVVSSSLPIPNNIETNFYDNSTSCIKTHDQYQNLGTCDIPPTIYPSTNEASRIVEDITSSNLCPSASSTNCNAACSNNTFVSDCINQEQHTTVGTQSTEPIVIRKSLPNNTVTYQQNVAVRYLQPPTPPPPGPIIIREVRPPPPPPQSPIKVRQRPPAPPTPPPLVIRERPPPAPCPLPSQVVEKVLPPPPCQPRRMIVERYAPCPPKPPDVVIERWLPYKRGDRRKILFERAPTPHMLPREPNLLILHDRPQTRIHKEFINQGVVRADPQEYVQRYGAELGSCHVNPNFASLVDEASRALPPPPRPSFSIDDHHLHQYHHQQPYYGRQSPHISSDFTRARSVSPVPHSTSFQQYYGSQSPHISSDFTRARSVSSVPHSASFQQYYGSQSPHISSDFTRARSVSPVPHSTSFQQYYGSQSPHISNDFTRARPVSSVPHSASFQQYYGSQSPHISSDFTRARSLSPVPHSVSFQHDYSQYNSPNYYSTQSSYRDHMIPSYHSYDNYATHRRDVRTMVDVTPTWNRNCYPTSPHSHLPSYQFLSSSSPPLPHHAQTIRANSDAEFQHILSNLTNGRLPPSFRPY